MGKKKRTINFQVKCAHGNIGRGVVNIYLNVRSLYNKMSEIKSFVVKKTPHILAISENELSKSGHHEQSLEIPGYDLLMPKSWLECYVC